MKIMGMNTHIPSSEELRLAKGLGCRQIRVDCNWFQVEPERGVYDFDTMDRIVSEAETLGLKLFITLAYTPAWMGHRTSVPDMQAWAVFVGMVAGRYKGKVEAYGLWNEPNLPSFFAGTMSQYIEVLLRPGWLEVRQHDPSALVVAPGISTSGSSWPTWMDAMVGERDYFDVFDLHCYKDTAGDLQKAFATGSNKWLQWLVPKYRPYNPYIARIGKPAWLTEFGWASSKHGLEGQASRYFSFRDSVVLPVLLAYAYELKDANVSGIPQWGLLFNSGTGKPAARAIGDSRRLL